MHSTFQVRFGQDAYPISRFIVERARTLGLSRTEFARRLGYKNTSKAHNALTTALTTGAVPLHMRGHLADALEVDTTLVNAVMDATSQQRQDESRSQLLNREKAYLAGFRPHLRAVTSRQIPEPIFIAALIGTARLLGVELPTEIWDASTEAQERWVKRAIQDHYRQHNGNVPAFGAIISYTLVTLPGYLVDFGFPFDTAGDPAGPMQAVKRLGEASLGVKRGDTRLTGLLRNIPRST